MVFSLRLRLLAFGLLAVLPALLLIFYNAEQQGERTTKRAHAAAMSLARIVANDQERLIDSTRQLLTTLSYVPELAQRDPTACNALLAEVLRQHPVYTHLIVMETNGDVRCSAPMAKDVINVSSCNAFQRALATRQFAIGDYQIDAFTGLPDFGMDFPVLDESGAVKFGLCAGADSNYVNKLAAAAKLPEGSTVTIFDSAGTVYVRYPDPQQWIGHSAANSKVFQAILSLHGDGTMEANDLDETPRLYAFHTLIGGQQPGPYLAVGVPKDVAFAEVRVALIRNLTALGLVTPLILAAVWFGADVLVLRRVRPLIDAVRKLAAGDLTARSGPATTRDELGELARAFDEMAVALQARQMLEARLRQSQKMETIGQLTGGIAHDFNNVLGVIIGNLDLAEIELAQSGNERALKRVQTALKAALQEAELTKRLLAFSRAQSAAPATVVDLNRLVREMLDLIQRTLGPSVKVEPRLAEDLWLARLDSNEFENVLLNLVLNARDAMPRGGQLTLVTKNHVLDATGARNLGEDVAAGEYVALSVSDTGTGMPPEVQARMFEPFFTTKPRELGTGLGLAMVQTFVKHGKGYIKVDSQPGRGTTIQLGLPRAQAQAAHARPPESAALPTGHETILVVEDETALLEVAVTYLTDLGYRALPAADVATALDILHREKSIDLLFTDVVMPGVTDGIALAEAARIFLPDIKVLFTSAFPKQGLEAREGRVLEVPLLGKPYRKAELAREIRNALDGRGGASRAI